MKGRYWDYDKNEPMEQLKAFLEEKVQSVKRRILEATKVVIEPIYYSAGFKEEGMEQCRPYDLSKLLYYIVKATPSEKRAVYIDNINQNENMWKDDDDLLDYSKETRKTIIELITKNAAKGADIEATLEEFLEEQEKKLEERQEALWKVLQEYLKVFLDNQR